MMKIKYRFKHLWLAMALSVVFIVFSFSFKKEKKPNVLIISPDQYRQFSLGFWSQGDNAKHIQGKPDPVKTPALDKLANEGIVFSRAMSNFPLSSPFRGMLMTGKYPCHNGLTANCHKTRQEGIRIDGESLGNIFNEAGYETAYFGKCHWQRTEPLFDEEGNYQGTADAPGGHYVTDYDTYVPPGAPRLGFSYFFQTLRDKHSDPFCYSSDPQAIGNRADGELFRPRRFNAELEAEAVLNYLDNSHGQRDADKPFFITWSLNPPHNPWVEEHTDMRFFPQYTVDGQVKVDQLLARENSDSMVGNYAPYYFANVSAVDFYIGKVLDKLKEMGEEENTIIVFTSDHGEMLGSHQFTGKLRPEVEAFNIPFIVKWGKKLQHRVDDLILSVPDIMPTVLAMAGLKSDIPETVQGVNYANVILKSEKSKIDKPKSALYMDYYSRGLFTGDYTFVVQATKKNKFSEVFYYDNKKDPYQLHRIKGSEMDPQLEKTLKAELVRQLVAVDDTWAQKQICGEYLEY
ncbi:MAG: sulfatase-like hydrolase/transferase [Breznakibacter sp.]